MGRCRHLHRRRASTRRRTRERHRSTGLTARICDGHDEAVAGTADGSTVVIGGFGMAGMPVDLIDTLIRQGATDLTIMSNNAGNDNVGLAMLLATGRIRKIICSYPRQVDSWVFDDLYRADLIELEVVPQGNLAERMRAAGASIGAFYSPTTVRTPLAAGKEIREIDGRAYVLEFPIHGDLALIRAHVADRMGNLVYRRTARNFGPAMATAARTVAVQVDRVVRTGTLDSENAGEPGTAAGPDHDPRERAADGDGPDTGVGPCVDVRGTAGEHAVVSLHADGATPAGHGFHVAYADPPLNPTQAGPARVLVATLRDALRSNGFLVSDYTGRDGLSARPDLAGLNPLDPADRARGVRQHTQRRRGRAHRYYRRSRTLRRPPRVRPRAALLRRCTARERPAALRDRRRRRDPGLPGSLKAEGSPVSK
ncbi:3-oxoacid CoA-transferase subunit A [Pseudonocardia sp. GCM10023141]|uniref:3-oxoacid CoA-transferase subunit A n=1 Tax=Pseudonocardia sp. GCM10023141 TaxID=3252653 RepID=UPI003623261A